MCEKWLHFRCSDKPLAELEALGDSDKPFISSDRCEMCLLPFSCVVEKIDLITDYVTPPKLNSTNSSIAYWKKENRPNCLEKPLNPKRMRIERITILLEKSSQKRKNEGKKLTFAN